MCGTIDTEKRLAGFFALDGEPTATPLCVACVAYPVEQFTRHIEKDVNIDGTVECLDGASDFLSGAFNSRTRDPIFEDEQVRV